MAEASPDDEPPAPPAGRSAAAWLWLGAQLLGTAGGFAWIAATVDLARVKDRVLAVPPLAFAAALALTFAGLTVGATRWRVVLGAYGAPARPPLRRLVQLYLVGFFYNTYLPGGVGGDVVRGVVTREAFGERGTTGAVAVVLVERVLGLVGLLLVVAGVLAWRPPAELEGALPWALLGIAGALTAVAGLALARRLAPHLPGPLARLAGGLPTLASPGRFALATALSLVTQSLVALSGWVLLHGLDPRATLAQAFVVVPVAAATAFLPITVGGAGAREAAFVALCAAVSPIGETDATAAALAMWGAQLVVAGAGGLLQLVRPSR
ncbi:MAG TPA: lysylphosphatidylglycerol synthase transmembrane domain-containing protein [Polyangiaceae bacterium LLY-WYZ-15_(1-7)]|nr:hypothetical protein [Myxococcales bacterium]MAT29285.1 hypothetical protein [Sandaracinus sp.]HJK89402.1 lysylphosphatidylglycerol synthase transmembrane domain-containing protein [Polyangiaceae bacterium LLY-WYZ-15_(1-7)]HJL05464.1 lysylphosphatidylglycerol synthase transmembrane domain-containing protein [Polyangiaceae bacterium LLY-WYZ-15_(1-7)]HJL12799.1 lysylphosphatidylglycerol synthase transmembrane domain-containing protein [Polyangiaceae bacterium LLY-WYZ-15_(1-7)]